MRDMNITYKGLYLNPQTNEYVRVKQYMYAEDGDGRFLLLRFENVGRNVVRGLTVSVSQYDAAGKLLQTERYSTEGYKVGHKGKFAFRDKIPLDEYCADFKVEIISVNFGKFKYGSEGYKKGLSYSGGETPAREGKSVAYEKKERKVKIAPVTAAIVALLLVAVAAIAAVVVVNFKKDKSDFIINNVNYAFENGDDSEESNIFVTGYRGKASKVVIPEYIEKHKVTEIKSEAFKDKKTVNYIVIKGDPIIEERAFYSCPNLEKVDFGGVTTIGDKAFYSCKKLGEVKSENITEIGASAFESCAKLKSVSISHDGDVVIKSGAFSYCSSLNNVDIDCFINYKKSGTKFFEHSGVINTFHLKNFNYAEKGSVGGGKLSVLFSDKASDDKNGAGDITIDYIDAIVPQMCLGTSVTSFTVTASEINEISESAFENCKKLDSVSMPSPVGKIGKHAFYETALSFIDLSKAAEIGEAAFYNCKNLDVDLKDNSLLKEIKNDVFFGCESLKIIYVPKSLTAIGENAFCGAASLTELKDFVSSQVNKIGTCAFKDCKALTAFACTDGLSTIENSTFEGCASLKSFTIGSDIQSIGSSAFAGCTSLTEIDLTAASEKLTTLGENAFSGCTSLEKFRSPFMGANSGSSSAEFLFGSKNSLKTIELTGDVTLSDYSLKGCDVLKELTVPNVTTAMGMFGIIDEDSEYVIPLEKVTLTKTNSIGKNAFYNCYKLREINYPDTVTSIGESAFEKCLKLEKIILPEGLSSIGTNAFWQCYKLNEIFDKSGMVERGSGAGLYAIKVYDKESEAPKIIESGDYKLMYDEYNKRWLYINYYGSGTNLTFPTGLTDDSGKSIESYGINDYLLVGESKIESVSFGKINYIGEGAFSSCSSLATFSATESTATSIGALTFFKCENLKSFNMPSVTSVGDKAFYDCNRLESVTLSANTIETDAFTNCFRLYEVKNAGSLNLEKGKDTHGGIAKYALGVYKDTKDGLGTWTNKDVTYKSADDKTWYVTDYTGSSTADIGALSGVNDIIIADYAFYNNKNLKGVTADSTVKRFFANSFLGCEATLETLDLSKSSITEIPSKSLRNFTALKTAYLPDALTSIEKGVLSGCTAIEKLSAPYIGTDESVSYLFAEGYSASIPPIKEITLTKANGVCANCFNGLPYLEKVILPSEVASIGQYAFYDCSALKEINLGDTKVKSIGEYAFSGCYKLGSVSFPSALSSIGTNAFEYTGITAVNLANTKITTIENNVFIGCTSLKNVTLSSGVTTIGEYAFSGCNQMTSFDFNGAKVSNIPECAFNGCYSLSAISLPDSVNSIGANAFSGSGIKNLVLPKNVSYMGSNAFYDCSSLVSVTINGTVLGEGAFSNCSSLKTATISGNINNIPASAFSRCSALTSITLPGSVTSIGNYAFNYCIALEKITLPSGLSTIGEYAFYGCSKLKDVNLGSTKVGSIETYAFRDCSSLTSITLPKTLSSVSSDAFEGCKNLREVFNNSPWFSDLTKGSDDCGQVAKYAVAIGKTLTYQTVGDFEFAGYDDNWFLYRYNGYGSYQITLPESFNVGGKTITSYTINNYAFESYVSYLILPTSVTAVEEKAFYSVGTIYFKHTTEAAAIKISGYENLNTGSTNAYLYAECAHGDNKHWTYDDGGNVTLNSGFTHVPEKEATETEDGNIEYWYCERCKKYFNKNGDVISESTIIITKKK